MLGVVGDAWTGVSYVRFHQPFRRLAGWRLRTLGANLTLRRAPGGTGWVPDASILDGVDVLMFPQAVAAPALADGSRLLLVEPLCALAAERGIPVVWSVDDDLDALEATNPGVETVHRAQENRDALLERADAIFVTTEPLRETLAVHGKPIVVLPNTVDPDDWTERPRAARPERIGWAGSSSHLDDLWLLLPALELLQSRMGAPFSILGLCDRPFEDELRSIRAHRRDFGPAQRERARLFSDVVERLRGIEHAHRPFGPVREYLRALPAADLAVGLCPLRDTRFNRHKSALKFYEYAMAGTLTLASDVPPYRGEVDETVPDDPAAWADRIERWLRDPAARERALEAQRAHVLQERGIGRWTGAWERALDEVAARTCAAAGGDSR